jgi:UDP-N-acetylmuramate dehydrogenase
MVSAKQNEPLKNYCTYGIGGPARVLLAAKNTDEILAGLEMARKDKLPFFILGGGSNLLFSDAGFDGLVIRIENNFIDIVEKKENGASLLAGAGTPLAALVNFARDNSLSGMEWAAGIPGTFGGAIRGNAGAFGHDMGEAVLRVEALEVSLEKIIKKAIDKNDCEFSYRNSIFKKNKNLVVAAAEIFLQKGDRAAIVAAMDESAAKKRSSQPLDYPSAGSVFANRENFFAAKIIEDCGFKGKIYGGAQISEKHANFIVNLGNAKSSDILALIAQIKSVAKEKFGVDLQEEIEIVEG